MENSGRLDGDILNININHINFEDGSAFTKGDTVGLESTCKLDKEDMDKLDRDIEKHMEDMNMLDSDIEKLRMCSPRGARGVRGEVPGSSPRSPRKDIWSRSPRRELSPHLNREIPGTLSLTPRKEGSRTPVFSEDDEGELRPPGQRLAPLGQEDEQEANIAPEHKIRLMEEEQEQLNSSLMALTSHYAKVQFRLQQILAAPADTRDQLLKDLEQFAFRGIPDINTTRHKSLNIGNNIENKQEKAQEDLRRKQREAIEQLRGQLEELESYAYQSGEAAAPSSLLMRRQRVVMEQLRARLNLNVEDVAALSEEELKAEVDSAVGQIVTPLRMSSQLINQLKTQVTDLELFIQFLQEDASMKLPGEVNCGCDKHDQSAPSIGNKQGPNKQRCRKDLEEERMSLLNRAIQVLQSATAMSATLGCGADTFRKNTLKKTPKGSHFGDLRARLELAVERLLDICCRTDSRTEGDTTDTDSADTEFLVRSPEVTAIVRKELAVAIRDLIHHGLYQGGGGGSMVPFSSCMSARAAKEHATIVHAWDLVLKFYEMKGGAEFNSAPARKLSHSFGLDLVGPSVSNKQALLQTIGHITASHSRYKRSHDAQFKAFICAGLNKRKLIPWLRLILRNQTTVETFYQPWSYVTVTGFDDGFRLLERLSLYVFDLPVNFAVRQFQNMSEAF